MNKFMLGLTGAVMGLALSIPGVAGAATIPVTGTISPGSDGTCGDFVQTGEVSGCTAKG